MKSSFIFSTDSTLALREAAAYGKLNKIKEILADPSFKAINAQGGSSLQTALHRACKNKYAELALYLAIRGAKIELMDKDNKTPVMYCRKWIACLLQN